MTNNESEFGLYLKLFLFQSYDLFSASKSCTPLRTEDKRQKIHLAQWTLRDEDLEETLLSWFGSALVLDHQNADIFVAIPALL